MSSATLHPRVGWLVACAIAFALAIAASAWTRTSARPEPRADVLPLDARATCAERITDWLVAYVAIGIALVQVLGFAGWFRVAPVLLAAAACAAIGLAARGLTTLRARIADLTECARALTRSLPLVAASVLGLALWVRAVAQREVSWDGLIYHLTYPAVWIRHGGFVSFDAPGIWEQFESFPKGAEALYALAMLPLRADDLTFLVHPVLWLGTGCAIYAAARRIGCPRSIAELTAACAISSPALGAFISPANVEIPVAFAISAATSAAARALVAREPEALGPCVLALCLGASIKITSLAYLPAGFIVMLVCARTAGLASFASRNLRVTATAPKTPNSEKLIVSRTWRLRRLGGLTCGHLASGQQLASCTRHVLRDAALGVVIALPWYANNFVHCDNALYPAAWPGAQVGAAAGTLANAWVVRDSSVLAQRVVFDVLNALARPPWAASYPGPGWLYLFAMLASTCLIVWFQLARSSEASKNTGPSSGGNGAPAEGGPIRRARRAVSNDAERSTSAGNEAWSAGFSRAESDTPDEPTQALRSGSDTPSEATRGLFDANHANDAAGGVLEQTAARERPRGLGERRAAPDEVAHLQLRAALVFAAIAWLLSLLYLVMPWNGIFWAANTRFLTPALLMALLSVAAFTALTPRWLTVSIWTIAVTIAIASWCTPRFWTAIRWPAAPAAVVLGLAHDPAQIRDTAARGRFPQAAPLTHFWQHIDSLPPSRIAYAVGGVDADEGWLFYPLFGSALQHDVRYIDVERVATRACQRRGMIRDNLDEAAWLERLTAERIEWFVISGAPQERTWIEAQPGRFTLAYQAGDQRLYAVH